jgi:hypothetical protein
LCFCPKGARRRRHGWAGNPRSRLSCAPAAQDRSTPGSTWRLVLPPHISLENSIRHGAFDSRDKDEKYPAGAILKIEYNANPKSRKNTGAPGETVFRSVPAATTEQAVWDSRGSNQFYPDPLAESLVIALRPAGTKPGEAYFAGPRVTVPLRVPKDDFANIVPVAIEARRPVGKGARQRADASRLSARQARAAADDERRGADCGGETVASVEANLVTFVLAPGEAVEADCWFVPSEQTLRRYFELPETLAIMMALKPVAELSDRLKAAKASAAKFTPGGWAGLAGVPLAAADVAGWKARRIKFLSQPLCH